MDEFTSRSKDMSRGVWRHRDLALMLARRDIIGRYRGSLLGVLRSLAYPLFMLAIYSFVFGGIFNFRWEDGSRSLLEFSLIIFIGMMIFNLFSECISRSPGVMLINSNYVKKVVFPLEVLPIVLLAGALFQFLLNLCVWLLFYVLFFQHPHPTALLLPLVILPLLLFTLGVSWVLASLGIYLRNIAHRVGALVTALLFLSPIFYPVTALPERFQALMYLNPLAQVIENARLVLIVGRLPGLGPWCLSLLVSGVVAWLGLAFFQRTRGGFADAL